MVRIKGCSRGTRGQSGLNRTEEGERTWHHWDIVAGEHLLESRCPTPMPSDSEDDAWVECSPGTALTPSGVMSKPEARTPGIGASQAAGRSGEHVGTFSTPIQGVPAARTNLQDDCSRIDVLHQGGSLGERQHQGKSVARDLAESSPPPAGPSPPSWGGATARGGRADKFFPSTF